MDFEKMGRFIVCLRREKRLTQLQLANYFDVNVKVISKLENGAFPIELSMLNDLSVFFDVSIEELLAGERKNDTNESKVKMIKICCFILISVCLFIFLFWKDKFSNCEIYSLNGYSEKYLISGFAVKKSDFNYIVIDSIINNDDIDLEVYSFQYSFYSDGVLLYKSGNISSYVHSNKNPVFSLNELLKNVNIFINGSVETGIHLSFFKQMYLEVYYIDTTLTTKLLVIPIKVCKE